MIGQQRRRQSLPAYTICNMQLTLALKPPEAQTDTPQETRSALYLLMKMPKCVGKPSRLPIRADVVCPQCYSENMPHNANLQLWRKKENDACPLCREGQTLIHVLNCRRVARDLRRYNQHHGLVLGLIAMLKLPPSARFSADLSDNYNFPLLIISTDLRPDTVWWNDALRKWS